MSEKITVFLRKEKIINEEENSEDMIKRVFSAIANIEQKYNENANKYNWLIIDTTHKTIEETVNECVYLFQKLQK